jgi:subtilisin family serine protease
VLAPVSIVLLFGGATGELENPAPHEATWVFFDARAQSSSGEDEVSPRAQRRRAKNGAGVGPRDRWPAASMVSAVLAHGVTLRARSRWLNAISVSASAETMAEVLPRLRAIPGVASVRSVGRRAAPETGTGPVSRGPRDLLTNPQLELMGAHYLKACGFDGAGVVIAVQDTGFVLEHDALRNVDVMATRDFLNGDSDVGIEADDAEGQEAHGTMVLSLIAGDDPGTYESPAPRARYVLSKTEDVAVEMPFEEDRFVEGLEWAEAIGADIFTASLGYIDWYEYEDLDGQTAVTTLAVNQAVANGLLVFNANGNGGPAPASLIAPADAEGVIAVGAVDTLGGLAPFSSRGPTADGRIKPDLVAPGRQVTVASWTENSEYLVGDGTSFATPLLAGLAAQLVQAYPNRTAEQLRALLKATASDTSNPSNEWGWGLVSGLGAGLEACSCLDVDQDGSLDPLCGGLDCDDSDPGVRPTATEACDGVDTDCDGALGPDEEDADRDGVPICAGDCADDDPEIHPAKPEICDNGIDDDCDGLIDGQDASECDPEDGGGTGDTAGGVEGGACRCTTGRDPDRGGWLLLGIIAGLRRRSTQSRASYSPASPAVA